MTEPVQFSTVVLGGSAIATTSVDTVIAVAATPVANSNTWAATGTLNQVTLTAAGGALEAAHGTGTRSFHATFHGRVAKVAGVAGVVAVHVYKNGAPLANALRREITVDPSNPASEFTMTAVIPLAPTDNLEIWLENVDDTDNVRLIEGATLAIKS